MTAMDSKPAPCPFCGSENAAPYSAKSCWSVLCTACGGEGPESDREQAAIAAWNRRAAPPSDTALLRQCLEALETCSYLHDGLPEQYYDAQKVNAAIAAARQALKDKP